ncbi:hypothetical protein EKN56_19805 [Limnobaculum zhutongyuii]|uniref:Uncharacterized protein n=1 Tax=Limnobaculum zhutongyuii TaxID=2498113 RepID=A0A411WQG9_9GAMM|nr:hypothetical protein [Limnobaculum zhutongyuii]QBH98438.1 hypothetical protein EKN56_19805 [Limnobaculum zhutongyuii]TQS89664.1 hypothetical protein ELQ32_04435 [Limnobaculum zhutongyuii]
MCNLPIVHKESFSEKPLIEKRDFRCISEFNDVERLAYYANAAKTYAKQIRELYIGLLDTPLRKADIATAARMWSLTQELQVMVGLTVNGIEKVTGVRHE